MILRARAVPRTPLEPEVVFRRLAKRSEVFWLDSSMRRRTDGRYSVMGCEPRWTFTMRGDSWILRDHSGGQKGGTSHALEEFDRLTDQCRADVSDEGPDLPFWGGAVGWLAYDLGRRFERISDRTPDVAAVPDLHFGWYDAGLVWDHEASTMWVVGVDGVRSADTAISELWEWATETANFETPCRTRPLARGGAAKSNFSRNDYLKGVAEVRQGIARGEYYQLNLVQQFTCPMPTPPADTYLRLRSINPAPFSAFLASEHCTLLCSSPERFIEVTPAGRIRTCPIKGTRPRGLLPDEDRHNYEALLASEKERAELLMIVDLLRNDLGRICEPGSIRVDRLHAVESFATVHHLVGEIQGQITPGTSRRELLRAVFPGGSITGAPKVSAMREIDRLEREPRGIAMGSLGYFSAHGRVDLNIAIRTIVVRGDEARVAVGAGIVWDSEPVAEYEETLTKARALFEALGVSEISP